MMRDKPGRANGRRRLPRGAMPAGGQGVGVVGWYRPRNWAGLRRGRGAGPAGLGGVGPWRGATGGGFGGWAAPTGSNVTVTCSGATVDQGPGINTGYGNGTQNGLTINVQSGASVTGTSTGIDVNANTTINNFG